MISFVRRITSSSEIFSAQRLILLLTLSAKYEIDSLELDFESKIFHLFFYVSLR